MQATPMNYHHADTIVRFCMQLYSVDVINEDEALQHLDANTPSKTPSELVTKD